MDDGEATVKEACDGCGGHLSWVDRCTVCSNECTWCMECTEGVGWNCPNCAESLRRRRTAGTRPIGG